MAAAAAPNLADARAVLVEFVEGYGGTADTVDRLLEDPLDQEPQPDNLRRKATYYALAKIAGAVRPKALALQTPLLTRTCAPARRRAARGGASSCPTR